MGAKRLGSKTSREGNGLGAKCLRTTGNILVGETSSYHVCQMQDLAQILGVSRAVQAKKNIL